MLTVGEVCKPARRKYPKRIVPWNGFANRQQEIWKPIQASLTYSQRLLDTINRKTLVAVRSEADVAISEGVAVLQPVEAILQQFFKDGPLREQLEQLQLPGHVTFVNHLNLNLGSQDASTLPKNGPSPAVIQSHNTKAKIIPRTSVVKRINFALSNLRMEKKIQSRESIG